MSLFDPRIWGAFILAAALSSIASYFKGSHDAHKRDALELAAHTAEANREARKNEQLRQDRVDDAAKSAAARERRILADAARNRGELDGLRGDLDALQRAGAESLAAANKTVRVTSGLLATCASRYSAVAEDAARADAEARELRAAWPQ